MGVELGLPVPGERVYECGAGPAWAGRARDSIPCFGPVWPFIVCLLLEGPGIGVFWASRAEVRAKRGCEGCNQGGWCVMSYVRVESRGP